MVGAHWLLATKTVLLSVAHAHPPIVSDDVGRCVRLFVCLSLHLSLDSCSH